MLQAANYPWRELRGCSCRRFCEGVFRQGKYLWIRAPNATGIFEPLRLPMRLEEFNGPGDCDWNGSTVIRAVGELWLVSAQMLSTASGPFGQPIGWTFGLSVQPIFFGPSAYVGQKGANTTYPYNCRMVPDFVLEPVDYVPFGGGPWPATAWNGPIETLWGWPGKSPF